MAAAFWHKTRPDSVLTEGLAWGDSNAEKLLPLWVWIYCVVWWLVQDIVKVIAHHFMDWIDLFGCVSDTAGSGPIKPYSDGVNEEEVKKHAEKTGAAQSASKSGTEKAAPENNESSPKVYSPKEKKNDVKQ